MLDTKQADIRDLDKIEELENLCFDEDERASRESLKERLEVYPNHFWLLERNGKLVAMVNGMSTNSKTLEDSMYKDASLHQEDGNYQMMFGVATHPDFRGRGYATILMKKAIRDCLDDSRKGILLTCKEQYIPFYEKLGFKNQGVADSNHGGKTWYLMKMDLNDKD